MKTFFCFSFILLAAVLTRSSHGGFSGKGHVHTLSKTTQVFWNPHCRSTDTCDLKRFALTTSVEEVWFSDDPHHPTYGNAATIEYETDSVAALEKYAIVQFIRGCVFHTAKTGAGKITAQITELVPSFGEAIPFCFPAWIIDSQDSDPAYNSDPEFGRFHLLRWNRSGSYDSRTEKYYGVEKPRTPVVYLTDYPDGAFVTRSGVKNAALEFRTCIYKAGDVPFEAKRSDTDFAAPLACFGWQNIYMYDFEKGKFRTDAADFFRPHHLSARPDATVIFGFTTLSLIFALLVLARSGVLPQPNKSE